MAVPLRLKVFKGEELVATRDFDRDMIKIGRLSTAHLCVDDEKASRIHSVLNVEGDGKLSIVDMGSVEGTYLNGRRINKGFVNFGDEIRIGATRIVVEEGVRGAEAAAAPAVAQALPPAPPAPAAAVPAVDHFGTYAEPAPQMSAAQPTFASAGSAAVAVALSPAAAPAPAVAAVPAPQPAHYESLPEATAPVPEGRQRSLHLTPRAFASYLPQRPQPRHPQAGGGQLGLQIRYYWGDQLLQVSQHAAPAKIFVGPTSDCDLCLDASKLGDTRFELVSPGGDGYSLNVGPGMKGELERGGQSSPLSAGSHDLHPTDFAWVEFAGLRAELNFAQQAKRVAVPLSQTIDYRFLNMFLLFAIMMTGFVITAITRTEADVVADELSMGKLVVAKVLLKEAEKPKKNALLDKLSAIKEPAPGEMAEKHKGEEGKMGKKDAPVKKDNRSAPKAIDINAKDLVKNSGLLKPMGSGGGGGLSTVFGQGGLGGDLKGALGNMFGPKVGDSGGFGGLGLKGTGTGGGGMGNTIGIGGVGTKGRGGGLGGYGTGVGGLGPKKSADVSIKDDEGDISGQLDKELIRKVIRANMGQIRYCYEQQLQQNPNLAGKVAVRFMIGPDGRVQSAKVAESSTLNEPRLGECLTVRVRSWQFPSPKGGGNVVVTYPFVFKPSGE